MTVVKLQNNVRGYSLIELLISMAIGLFILAGVVTVMLDGKRNFNHQDEISYLQENARFIKDTLSRDIKMAGYAGCGILEATPVNTLNPPADTEYALGEVAGGSEYVSGAWVPVLAGEWTSITGIDTGSDTLSLGGIFGAGARLAKAMPNTSGVLKVITPTFLEDGDIMFISDCKDSAIAQLHNVTTTGSSPKNDSLVRNQGAGTPGNSTKNLGKQFGTDAEVFLFEIRRYYIADSGIGDASALWRKSNLRAADELVSGVESLQIEFGIDTSVGTVVGPATYGDGVVNRYVGARDITLDVAVTPAWIGWDRVLSVRVNLILRSAGPVYLSDMAVTLNGTNYNDRYLRQRVSFVARMRNRGV